MTRASTLRIVLIYALAAALWIVISDVAVHADLRSAETWLSIAKGLAFVAVTATLLYVLIRRLGRDEDTRYQAMFADHPLPVLLIDPAAEGEIVEANAAAERFYGLARGRLRTMRISGINTLSPAEIAAEMARARSERKNEFHFRHRLGSGEEREVEVHSGPVTIGGRALLYSIVIDETERRRAAQGLARQRDLYAAISEIGTAVTRLPDEAEIYAEVCRIAVERAGFAFAWIGEFDEASGTLRFMTHRGDDQGYIARLRQTLEPAVQAGRGPTAAALRRGELRVVNDFLADPDLAVWHEAARAAGVRAAAAFPLRRGGRVHAVLNVYSHRTGVFDDPLVALLKSLAGTVSFALDNAERARRAAEDARALVLAEERWRFALEGAGHGVWEWNVRTDRVFFSRQWKAMLGYADDEIGSDLSEWRTRVHPDDLAAAERELRRHLEGETPVYVSEHRLRCRDGGWKWILDRGKVISRGADGRPLLLVGTQTDIDASKRMERSLREALARLDEAQRIAHVGSWVYDHVTGRSEGWSGEMYRLLGTRPGGFEPSLDNYLERVHPEDRPRFLEQFAAWEAGAEDLVVRHRLVGLDGVERFVQHRARIERDGQGRPLRSIGTTQDVTEVERARRAAAEQEGKFRAVTEQSISGVYIIDQGRIAYANDRVAEVFGYTAAELQGMEVSQLVAPEDRALVEEDIRCRLAGDAKRLRYQFRGLRKDGAERVIGVHGSAADLGGRRVILGVLHDITDVVRAEEITREYIARIERMVIGAVDAMSAMVELRDPYTAGHERRVGELAAAIAAEMGLDEAMRRGLRIAGAVHDVGKVAVPAEILSKPTRLLPPEYEMVKAHAEQGYEVLSRIESPWPIAEVALQHHERIDGSGYPRGLKGEAILLEARIIGVADVIEAMASHRPYRPTVGLDQALAEIESGAGRRYDARAAEAALRLFREKGYTIPA